MAKPRKSYGKRPIWQWVVFYIIIGGIIYALLYYSGTINLGSFGQNYDTDYSSNSTDYNFIE